MDTATARALSALTSEFYRRTSASFSATRQAAWPGWDRVLLSCDVASSDDLTLFDLACGNLRFEKYLAARLRSVRAWVVDGNEDLVGCGMAELPANCSVSSRAVDVAEGLYRGDLTQALDAPPCDLAVSFGFLHHLPLPEHRAGVLRELVFRARPGGVVAVSFWQFDHDARLMRGARPVEGGDAGDYLLGWQGATAQRYCHSFTEAEVGELADSVAPSAREVARFSSDGRTGDLNRYLVLQRV